MIQKTDKKVALNEYKKAKAEVIKNYTFENWKKYCDAKRECMLLGIRI